MKKVQGEPCKICNGTTFRQKTEWYRDKKKFKSNPLPLICMTCGDGKKVKVFKLKETHVKLG